MWWQVVLLYSLGHQQTVIEAAGNAATITSHPQECLEECAFPRRRACQAELINKDTVTFCLHFGTLLGPLIRRASSESENRTTTRMAFRARFSNVPPIRNIMRTQLLWGRSDLNLIFMQCDIRDPKRRRVEWKQERNRGEMERCFLGHSIHCDIGLSYLTCVWNIKLT